MEGDKHSTNQQDGCLTALQLPTSPDEKKHELQALYNFFIMTWKM